MAITANTAPTNLHAGQKASSGIPRLVCVGTGRDGTASVNSLIQSIFDCTSRGTSIHEYCAREFYHAFTNLKETGNERFADDIRQMIADCPYDCIVGNGYAAILPYFVQQWGSNTKLVHIKRFDREACIASLVKNSEYFPAAYGYYASADNAKVKRMAAFHFGEMSKSEWDRMPIAARFGWYYDKTHALIELYKCLFDSSIDILTEKLNEESTRRALARLADGSATVVPPPVHLNAAAFDIGSLPQLQRDKAAWLLGRLNWASVLADDVYAIDYFLDKFVAWTGYQIKGEREDLAGLQRPSRSDTAKTLARARTILNNASEEIDELEKLNRERNE